MARFSEWMGIIKAKPLQLRSLDNETRASLWNICRRRWFISDGYQATSDNMVYYIARKLYEYFYKQPLDNIPWLATDFISTQLENFMKMQWWQILDLLEFFHNDCFVSGHDQQKKFARDTNDVLEREKSAYRF